MATKNFLFFAVCNLKKLPPLLLVMRHVSELKRKLTSKKIRTYIIIHFE